MKPIELLRCAAAAFACFASLAPGYAAQPQHEILICASASADPAIKQAADDLAASANSAPALKALIDTQHAGPVIRVTSESVLANAQLAAYNHLVIVGLKGSDPLLARVWDHYATVDETTRTVYSQGWGWLRGDIGIVASDWNAFLHSHTIQSAPFESAEFKLSGTSIAGLQAAVKAFERGMNNGFVPSGTVNRPETTLLDLDPKPDAAPLSLPAAFATPDGQGSLEYAGWTQAPGNEYRAYIDVATYEPSQVWRVKYLQADVLMQPWTPLEWLDGFHPMAFGNAVTIAQFASAAQAQQTAAGIGARRGWRPLKLPDGSPAWSAPMPTDEVITQSYGAIVVFARGPYVVLSSLPAAATAQIASEIR